jgi:phosphatidylserine/phosphatidylglycerophosphate/cardiolipin synthase-like enzyme
MSNQVEIVLTLPQSLGPKMAYLARARTTMGALTQMVAQAQNKLVMAAPYIKGDIFGQGVLQNALQYAVEQRHVQLSVVSTGNSLDEFLEIPWIITNRARIIFYRPKINVEIEQLGTHAKFCIADEVTAYIGSANLTFLGLHQHLEMGVLLHDDLAKQVYDFWKLLIANEFFIIDSLHNIK